MAVYFEENKFDGEFEARGGTGVIEHGASGTIYLKKNTGEDEHKTLKVYNQVNTARTQVILQNSSYWPYVSNVPGSFPTTKSTIYKHEQIHQHKNEQKLVRCEMNTIEEGTKKTWDRTKERNLVSFQQFLRRETGLKVNKEITTFFKFIFLFCSFVLFCSK